MIRSRFSSTFILRGIRWGGGIVTCFGLLSAYLSADDAPLVTEKRAPFLNLLDVRMLDGLVQTHATLVLEPDARRLERLKLAVPAGHRILGVVGVDVSAWKESTGDKSQVLDVELRPLESRATTIEVFTEFSPPDEPFGVGGIDERGVAHAIHSLDDVNESGWIAITTDGQASLSVVGKSGLARVDESMTPLPLRGRSGQVYRFFSPKFELRIALQTVEPGVAVEQQTRMLIRDGSIATETQFEFLIASPGVRELKFALPAGLIVEDVACANLKEFIVPEAGDQLIVALRDAVNGRVALTVRGQLDLDAEDHEPKPLPILEPLAAGRVTGRVAVYAPASLAVHVDEKLVQGAYAAPPGPEEPEWVSGARRVRGWSFRRSPEIPVRIDRVPVRLSASVATEVQPRGAAIDVDTVVAYQVESGGLATFRFALPAGAGEAPWITSNDPVGAPLYQVTRDEKTSGDWAPWTATLAREATGIIPLRVRYALKPALQDGKPAVKVEPVRVLESSAALEGGPPVVPLNVSGDMIVRIPPEMEVAVNPSAIEPVEDDSAPESLPGVLTYRYEVGPGGQPTPSLELTITPREIRPTLGTVATQAVIEAVVTGEKAVTYYCRYRLKSSVPELLAFTVPADSELLDVVAGGLRVSPVKDEPAPSKHSVTYRLDPVPGSRARDAWDLLTVYRAPFKDNPVRGRGGNLALPLPRLARIGDSARTSLAVQNLRVVIRIPHEYVLVGRPPLFDPVDSTSWARYRRASAQNDSVPDVVSAVGDELGDHVLDSSAGKAYVYERSGMADALEVSYWRTSWYTWMISGAVFLAGLMLGRTSWRNRWTIALIAAFAAAMYSVRDPDLTVNVLSAARYGLLATLGWWIVLAVTQPGGNVAPRSTSAARGSQGLGATTAAAPVAVPPAANAPRDQPPAQKA
ncbi:MAG: hypothetical protein ACT4QC_04110 [Planctomycetaceae bacterium]